MKIKKKSKNKLILAILIIAVCILLFSIFKYRDYKINYNKLLSKDGFELLNYYEFPWYMVEVDSQNISCMSPYDIGDGVITFGPGITYKTKEEGLEDINSRFYMSYTNDNDCINVDILFELQSQKMKIYEKYVTRFLYENRLKVGQRQFDGLVILAYNSPDFLKDQTVIDMLNSEPTKEEYIKAIDSYYKKLNAYYDNPNTQELNDGFGEGWYRRIVDSAEVYFDGEYMYQNNI